ncbi:MAG: efflux RND transporter periplasmic adaptor subunit [Leptolyngbyaceae cyanobacterium SL_1_1]|nr:efflux RND transporter periplasmic adaptor subunit [Leptolyngbyaceae cyanobacterium RM1_1_2]NJO08958.1 efflux RND transporter periplasmic adaptor subunit [Leptolyngbyaceae cyanobacterium SL_1_1]
MSSPTPQPSSLATSLETSKAGSTSAKNGQWQQRALWGLAGALVILGGGFLLWRVLAPKGPPPGAQIPQGVPVTLEAVQQGTLRDSSEFIGSLDAQAGVALQPEASGRITQIYVSSGDRVAAGAPILELSPDRTQAELSAAVANANAVRAARESSRSQLNSLLARRAEVEAEVNLQEEEYRRTAYLVDRGAQSDQELDIASRDREAARAGLRSAEQEIAAARASLEQANAAFEQAQADAAAVREDLQDRTVTAPIAGIVADIPAKLGDYVEPGSVMTTIVQNDTLELDLAIPIDQAERLTLGLPVELLGSDDQTSIATGSISFISPQADSDSQTVLAKARFENTSGRLQDDQRVNARVTWEQRPGVLVPTSAISRLGGQTFVYTIAEAEAEEQSGSKPGAGQGQQSPQSPGGDEQAPQQVARLRPVELGSIQDNSYQVISGLEPGETIIVSGVINLQDGVPIMPQTEETEESADQQAPQSP